MAKAILVVATSAGVGLTSVALGLVHALDRRGVPVGFCKPITQTPADNPVDRSTWLAQRLANLTPPEPLPLERAQDLLGQGRENELLENVVARYSQVARAAGVVIVEGLAPYPERGYLVNLNVKIAQALDADTILVTVPGRRTPDELQELLEIASQPYGGLDNERLPGCILNMVGAPVDESGRLRYDFVQEDADDGVGDEALSAYAVCPVFHTRQFQMLGCIPWRRSLMAPRVLDIVRFNGAELIHAGDLTRRVTHVALGARYLANGCSKFRPGALLITPGDRDDIVVGACLAALDGIPIGALLLTGGLRPSAEVLTLCRPALETGLPLLATPRHTIEVVLNINRFDLQAPADDPERIQAVTQHIAGGVNLGWIDQLQARTEERRLSPPAFRYALVERARRANKRIVLPEGDEPRTIQAAAECQRRGVARCVLLGKPESIRHVAARQGVELPADLELLDPQPLVADYIAPLVALRKGKGLTPEVAEEQLQDPVVLGTMMLQQGAVDGLVSGAVHTTANTIRPALQLIKTAPGARLVSSIFFMCLPTQVLVYGDCAVVPDPSAEDLADIAIQSAASAHAFGIEPRIAMLSYSTGESGVGGDVDKVRAATRLARERRPDLLIDGPLQYDAAAIREVARNKAPDSKVAGRATVFIFPDLNTGNTTYKAVQRSAEVISIGPMLQGLRKPVNDLSRGALVEDIVYTIALTAIQAQQAEAWAQPQASAKAG